MYESDILLLAHLSGLGRLRWGRGEDRSSAESDEASEAEAGGGEDAAVEEDVEFMQDVDPASQIILPPPLFSSAPDSGDAAWIGPHV